MIKERPKPRTTKKKPKSTEEQEVDEEFEDDLEFDDEEIEGPIYEPE